MGACYPKIPCFLTEYSISRSAGINKNEIDSDDWEKMAMIEH